MNAHADAPAPDHARVENCAGPADVDEGIHGPLSAGAQLNEELLPLAGRFVQHETFPPEKEGQRLDVAWASTGWPAARRAATRRPLLEATFRPTRNCGMDPKPQVDGVRQRRRVEDPVREQ